MDDCHWNERPLMREVYPQANRWMIWSLKVIDEMNNQLGLLYTDNIKWFFYSWLISDETNERLWRLVTQKSKWMVWSELINDEETFDHDGCLSLRPVVW